MTFGARLLVPYLLKLTIATVTGAYALLLVVNIPISAILSVVFYKKGVKNIETVYI